MAKTFRCRNLATALALTILLAVALYRYWAQGQALTGAGQRHLLTQPRHHIYEGTLAIHESNQYSCDFSALPGAWTGDALLENAAQISQSEAAHPATAQHLTAGGDPHGVTSSDASPLYGTAEAQATIWAHQHPQDCRSRRFLIHSPQVDAGIGSQLHVLGMALAVALDTDRVLLLKTNVQRALYTNDAYCGPERPNLDDCYFERLSSCTLADVELGANSTGAAARLIDLQHGALADLRVVVNDQLPSTPEGPAARAAAAGNLTFAWVPRRLQGLVDRSPVAQRKQSYWYRAQASMFIVQPNARTRAELARLRKLKLRNPLSSYASAISVHVRHGDKWKEVPEQSAQAYFKQAEVIQSTSRGMLRREIFLSTDDPSVVAWFAKNTIGWHISYTDSLRKPDPQKSRWEYAGERGYAAEYLDSLLNLNLALECGGWVGTLTSNWCRLIDELRSTARCKAGGMYLDAAQGDPPEDLGWRR